MALLFADGFDHVDDDDGLFAKWDYSNAATLMVCESGYGRTGGWGFCIRENDYIQRGITLGNDTIVMGAAVKIMYESLYANGLFLFLDGDTQQVCVNYGNGGKLVAYANEIEIGSSDGNVCALRTWQYIEVKIKFSATVGTIEVKVNGTTVLNLTGQNTASSGNAYCDTFRIKGNYGGGYTIYVDDLYICDTTGTDNNDFLGDIRVKTLYPTSDGNSSDFTPSTGVDNYATVDNPQLLDTNSDYNESSTVGHKDLYGMTTYSGTADILAVQVVALVENTDAGSMTVKPLSRSGATPTDNEGTEFALSQTIKAAMHIFEQEPTDSVDWTAAKVNSAEFGIKVQS